MHDIKVNQVTVLSHSGACVIERVDCFCAPCQDLLMAKEKEVRATFSHMTALNDRGDYVGASQLISVYTLLADELEGLKDRESQTQERLNRAQIPTLVELALPVA